MPSETQPESVEHELDRTGMDPLGRIVYDTHEWCETNRRRMLVVNEDGRHKQISSPSPMGGHGKCRIIQLKDGWIEHPTDASTNEAPTIGMLGETVREAIGGRKFIQPVDVSQKQEKR